MNTSVSLQKSVEEELRWDSSIRAEEIGVTVRGEVVQLDGYVGSFYEKWAAESAALRVHNVQGVANEIKVEFSSGDERSDSDIAQAAVSQLEWNCHVPDTVKVKVSNGWITFEGTVKSQHQADEAERVLRSLKGVRGMMNQISVEPDAKIALVKSSIIKAFERNSLIDADNIRVETSGGMVTLHGHVRSWAERDAVRRTVWSAPGVTYVEDLLTISSL